jgi:hypothetical protein
MLRQQRSERRWRIFFRLAWLGWCWRVPGLLFAQRLPVAASTPHTALVEVRGEIAADTEASAELLCRRSSSAFEDPGAGRGAAHQLARRQPGAERHRQRRDPRLKAKHNKKVYAVVEEICASGAYYIAVAADEIYVDKASIVGSIGVLMDGFGFTGLMDKLGVERRLLTAGDNKGMLDPFSPQNEQQTGLRQAMIDQIHQQFIAVVKEGRGERLKETPRPSRPVLERRGGREAGPGRQARQPRLRGARGGQGRGDHRLHAARQRGRAAGQALRRGVGAGRGAALRELRRCAEAGATERPRCRERLAVLPQYLLPKQALTALAGPLAGARGGALTTAVIRWFIARYGVDMAEAADPDPAAYASFNEFFTRALKPGARPLAAGRPGVPGGRRHQPVRRHRRRAHLPGQGPRLQRHRAGGRRRALAAHFHDGHFATLYLSPRDYHRIHMPCAGGCCA